MRHSTSVYSESKQSVEICKICKIFTSLQFLGDDFIWRDDMDNATPTWTKAKAERLMLPGSSRAQPQHATANRCTKYKETSILGIEIYRNRLSNLTHRRHVRHIWNLHPRVLHYVLCYVLFSLYNLYILYRLQVCIYIIYLYIHYAYISLHEWRAGHMHLCTGTCVCVPSYVFPCAYSVCIHAIECTATEAAEIYTRCVPASLPMGSYGYTYMAHVVFLWSQVTRAYKIVLVRWTSSKNTLVPLKLWHFIGSLKIIVSAKGVPARQSRSTADSRHLCAEALENVWANLYCTDLYSPFL